ncbi:MAG: threonine--tRNA ligase, partial [Bacteroidetes bacterium HGW-Bacteroidetes-14]
ASIDDRNETIGKKIRENELKRVPFLLIVGEKEADNGTISVRKQGDGDKGAMSVDDFRQMIESEIKQQIE